MKTHSKRIPRISTRGFYDLSSGKTLETRSYDLYPPKSFENLCGVPEMVIMIHGLQNNKVGALAKFVIARKRLKQIGYRHPVIGYTYDANTKGVHIRSTALKALKVGQKIAKKNSINLSKFIVDFKKKSPETKIRLIGHSLGTEVILYTIQRLATRSKNHGIIDSVHFFGASVQSSVVSSRAYGSVLQKVVRKKIKNYYSPGDEVLKKSEKEGSIKTPLGLFGANGKTIPKFTQKRVYPKNHRFASYAAVLKSFP
ncbi:MAG: DUF726 domain-containing protein [Nitrosopumilaceae archaeon]